MDWSERYAHKRSTVFGHNMVATSHPLASQAGLEMLRLGGNAVDAAVCAAITLTVVKPVMNGIGSDLFAFIWDQKMLHGLNASGRSPKNWNLDSFRKRYGDVMPLFGWDTVTVPGAVSAWVAMSERFSYLPFEKLFEAGVGYARNGYHVAQKVADMWSSAPERYQAFPEFLHTFCKEGKALMGGDLMHLPYHAETLQEIAISKGKSVYTGQLAERMVACSETAGGQMHLDDLALHQVDWVKGIETDFLGYGILELPPNGQGLAALIALGLLKKLPVLEYGFYDPRCLHYQIECMRLGLSVAYQHISDPSTMQVRVSELLSSEYLDRLLKMIPKSAGRGMVDLPTSQDTVYLTSADAQGNMVSLIQSNYMGFGSGVVVPGTGIALQNRGNGFSLTPGHPNCLDGAKRPFHTLIPGFVMQGGEPMMSYGVMGGDMQAQGHVQMVLKMLGYGLGPQAALDGPRWKLLRDGSLQVEPTFPLESIEGLEALGYNIGFLNSIEAGGGQIIYKLPNGQGYAGGTEPRLDGIVAAF